MRFHYIDRAGVTETLCGAPMPARYKMNVQNAPTVAVGVEAFERIDSKNRCIKCTKLLPRLKRKRQIAGERALRFHEEYKQRLQRSTELDRLGKMTDIELDFAVHEMVYGVPCGPVMRMVTDPKRFLVGLDALPYQ